MIHIREGVKNQNLKVAVRVGRLKRRLNHLQCMEYAGYSIALREIPQSSKRLTALRFCGIV